MWALVDLADDRVAYIAFIFRSWNSVHAYSPKMASRLLGKSLLASL